MKIILIRTRRDSIVDRSYANSPQSFMNSKFLGRSSLSMHSGFFNSLEPQLSSGSLEGAESYIRTVFSHISNLIWIKSIEVSPVNRYSANQSQEQIIVSCKPQGSTLEDESLAEKVIEAIRIRGDLQLIKIIITPTKHFEAIKQLSDSTYNASVYFSEFLARNDDYREDLKTADVVKVTYESKQVGEDRYKPTGKISTVTSGKKDSKFDPENIYNLYAVALSQSEGLRGAMLNENISRILLILNDQHCLDVDITLHRAFRFNFASLALRPSSEEDLEVSAANLNLGSDAPEVEKEDSGLPKPGKF